MEDFVPFKLAVKLEEKGFSCEYPFAMYNEDGLFFPLYSSDKYYYGIEDFDKNDYIAPTISQVLKWLREEKKIHLELVIVVDGEYMCDIYKIDVRPIKYLGSTEYSKTYEAAALSGIEYVLDNLL